MYRKWPSKYAHIHAYIISKRYWGETILSPQNPGEYWGESPRCPCGVGAYGVVERGLGGVVVIDAAIGAPGRGSRSAHYLTVAATLDKSLTSHCLYLRQAPVRLIAVN